MSHLPHNTVLYPVLPLRDIVVFPSMIVPLLVGREKSVRALEDVIKEGKLILFVTQKDANQDDPTPQDLYSMGTVGKIFQMVKLPDGGVKILVEGKYRANIVEFVDHEPFFQAYACIVEEKSEQDDDSDLKGLTRTVLSQFDQYTRLNKQILSEVPVALNQIDEPERLADTVAAHLALKIAEKQQLLSMTSVKERLEKISQLMEAEIDILQVERRIRNRVKRQMEKTQREFYLNEQLKAIQKELGENEEGRDELAELEETILKTKLSKEAREKAHAELKKLRSMSPISAEATVVRNYLDWLLKLPWNKKTRIKRDIKYAKKLLDTDHYGLDKVKERIIEYLSVQLRTNKLNGPILCLVGPPGVGKTSLGKSIARATGRNFVRISLGGVRDEAEIRGHRRTYIGSMPGKILQGMKKAKSSNPLFLLDEVDKLGTDWRGDPTSALIEVLDPEQNVAFNDHYLEVNYDLSQVMFICTANTLRMPEPLLDRMEVIHLSGYTEEEKIIIAKRHLFDKQRKNHGLEKDEFAISDESLRDLICYYTREAGVRNLEREIANLARKTIKKIIEQGKGHVHISRNNLAKYAGIRRYRFSQIEEENLIGITTGLAWTEVGGELLHIEAVTLPGKGKITTTGKLGDVMKESVQASESYVKSRAFTFGIARATLEQNDIHVHVPEGATPKDGPSAGVAMITSIVSVLTQNPVHRDIAMTGEITLRGRVLPIGGLKEKLLASLRGRLKTVLIPKDNEKDLIEIPDTIKRGLQIILVKDVEEVLSHALVHPLTPLEWEKPVTVSVPTASTDNAERIRH